MAKNKNLEFLGFFERCDRLVSYWSRFQAALIFIFYPLWPFAFIGKVDGLGFYLWLGHALLLTPIAIVGFFKSRSMGRIFNRALGLVSGHPNQKLVEAFRKIPRIIRTIKVLELFLPFTWMVSFPLKFLFYKNLNVIKSLIIDYKNLD